MDEKLFKATREGDTKALQDLIQNDPLILDRRSNTMTAHLETPLHIAALLGHVAYAAELLRRKPGLAREVDWRRSTALHLASARGEVGMVKALLRVYPDACSVCDRDGRNPVHIAAMMGRTDSLKEMMAARPDAARVPITHGAGGGTILHLCLEFSQLEALKVVMEGVDFTDLVNAKDRDGNTVLHLAVADKQVETTEYLLSSRGMDINAVNMKGMRAMDIVIERRRDKRDVEMEESLRRGGATAPNNTSPFLRRTKHKSSPTNTIPINNDWLDKKRSAIMIVASLIATMAFQVVVDPPDNLWQVTQTPSNTTTTGPNINGVYEFVKKGNDFLKRGEQFYIINTVSFIASLSTIMLLMSGLPLKSRFFVWILLMITWIAITGLALSYTVAVIIRTPPSKEKSINYIVGITVFSWICLITLLLIGHTVRLFLLTVSMFVKVIKLMIRGLTVRRRRPYTMNHSTV